MLITILTPTYNRSHTLPRLYNSLERQTCKDFNWLIVDDGSTDNTREIVDIFKEKTSMTIDYLLKENGGKHTAINEGVDLVKTKLIFIVDSDDYLTDDAVKTIYDLWEIYGDSIGGIWFLDKTPAGNIIGDKFPSDEIISDYVSIMINSKVRGDKATVYLTDALKEFKAPVFEGENRVPTGMIHKRISEKYKILFCNKAIYIAEYQEDGISKQGKAFRIRNPLGGMANSKEFLSNNIRFDIRLKKMILYLTYSFFARQKLINSIHNSGYTFFSLCCIPTAYIYYLYLKTLQIFNSN
jgi:glycosyltransferase involved in cell wall biosynthesis